jgi:hypothetical protein
MTKAGASTGWPEVVTRLRLPQNVACRFPALRSSEVASQHGDSLYPGMRDTALVATEEAVP